MILEILIQFNKDNKTNIDKGFKELSHKDLDVRLTRRGYVFKTNKVIEIHKILIEE